MIVALAQINTTIGDFEGNEAKILAAYQKACARGAELVMVPELATAGYPPRDLLLRKSFVEENLRGLERLAQATGPAGLLTGYIGWNRSGAGRALTNSVALLQDGQRLATRSKILLPTYDVFDEDRYFEPAENNTPVAFKGLQLGLTICEDVWSAEDFSREHGYRRNPAAELQAAGAEIICNVSASPWHLGKNHVRHQLLSRLARNAGAPVLYCNLVGGNDDLIFDGASLVFNAAGELCAQGKAFQEDLLLVDTAHLAPARAAARADEELVYHALVLGLRDYFHKCGFKAAVLGLSGGIDSALTAVLAADALGRENVLGVSLPSQFSSQGSLDDAQELARNLGIRYEVVSIQPIFEAAKRQLQPVFAGAPEDSTEENIQARVRGLVLMGLSNKFGSLLLSTGNKSELAVGYCTLYGDMNGGLAVISDVPKTMVYRLANWVNRENEIIPTASITKAPSAELRPNQTDQDSLPPYEVLDAIMERYVVELKSAAEIIREGFEEAAVKRVLRLIDINEYKRRQAAPGLKVTTKAFGVGRRIPIARRITPC